MSFSKKITFQINAEDKASSTLNKLKGNVSDFSKSTGGIKQVASIATKAVIGLTAGVAGLSTAMAYLGSKSVRDSMKMENAMLGLTTVAKAFNQNVDEAKEAAIRLSEDGLMTVSEAAEGLKNLLGAGFNMQEAINLMNGFKDAAAFNRQGTLAFGEAIVGATQGIKNQNSILVDNAGITKNLSIILKEAGYSIQDLGSVSSDSGVRMGLYNGLLKEMAVFSGDAERSAGTLTGTISMFKTAMFNANVAIGDSIRENSDLQEAFKTLSNLITNNSDAIAAKIGEVVAFINAKIREWIEEMGGQEGVTKKLKEIYTIITEDVLPIIVQLGKITAFVFKILAESVQSFQRDTETLFVVMFTVWNKVVSVIEWAYDKIKGVFDGIKSAFNSVAQSIKNGFASAVNFVIDKLNSLISKINKLPGVDVGEIGKVDFRAAGGPVSQGQPYVVGERGPEMFVPNQSGTIVPNHQMGATFNFNFSGATITNEDELIAKITNSLNRQLELAGKGLL